MNWIPIEGAVVAIFSGRPVLLHNRAWSIPVLVGGWDNNEQAWRVYGSGCPAAQPTHWMPLPEPPK